MLFRWAPPSAPVKKKKKAGGGGGYPDRAELKVLGGRKRDNLPAGKTSGALKKRKR